MQLSFSAFRTPSTKAGRRYCRLRAGDRVVFVELVGDADTMFLATRDARVIHFKIDDVPILGGPGKGVRGIKLAPDDEVLGAIQLARPSDCLHVINEQRQGAELRTDEIRRDVPRRQRDQDQHAHWIQGDRPTAHRAGRLGAI